MNTKRTGEASEAIIRAVLTLNGKIVLKPDGDNQRYDLVIDENGSFKRIQCKTARLTEDQSSLVFDTCSTVYGG